MKRTILLAVTAALSAASCATLANSHATPETEREQYSYSLGSFFGSRIKEVSDDLDPAMVKQGIEDALSDKKPAIDPDKMTRIIRKAQTEAAEKMAKKMEQQAAENSRKSAQFLAKNADKPGVIKTESGLQYTIITKGSGDKPEADSRVTVNYTGKLLDGTVFDSSYERNAPATFRVDQVIAGWQEALQLMQEGAEWKLYIPPRLGYGARGAPGGGIGPNELLIFDVKLEKTLPASS